MTKRAKIKGARKIKGREFRKMDQISSKVKDTSKTLFLEKYIKKSIYRILDPLHKVLIALCNQSIFQCVVLVPKSARTNKQTL